jgi:hypothetical protein
MQYFFLFSSILNFHVPDSEAVKTQDVLFEYIPALLYYVPHSSALTNYRKEWTTPHQLKHAFGTLFPEPHTVHL